VDNIITYQSANIFYRTTGKGPSVVLIHGFAEDSAIWDNQAAYLAKNFSLIIPDLPGSGKSTAATNYPASIDDHADCLKAILDAEKITGCCVIGHSMGGYISLAFAEKYPGMVKALGLFHSTAYADTEEKKVSRRKNIEFISKFGAAPFIRQSISNLFSDHSRNQMPQIAEELINRYANFNPGSLVSYLEAMIQRPDRVAILQNFPGPVLFIAGEKDTAVPLEHTLKQSHIPGLSYIHILENAGHLGMLEASIYCNQVLDKFLLETMH
jgi:pimeloyl-ACP methyl ester carboxylesterase